MKYTTKANAVGLGLDPPDPKNLYMYQVFAHHSLLHYNSIVFIVGYEQ